MKYVNYIVTWSLLLFIVSGCWDAKEIAEVNYVTILGIDYQDEEYTIYTQFLDFSNVAKQETGKAPQPSPLYIGKASSANVNDALEEFYRTSQQAINWAHIGAVIYSDSLLKQGIHQVQASLLRNGQLRYTPWMFGTEESIEEIMSLNGFFNLPPVYTILLKPMDTYHSNAYIAPMKMHQFVANYQEPGGTALLPSISINRENWKQAQEQIKPKEIFEINGMFPVYRGKSKDSLSLEESTGLRWAQNHTKNAMVNLVKDDQTVGAVKVENLSAKFDIVLEENDFHVDLLITADGSLTDVKESLSAKEMEQLVAAQIVKEVKQTYIIGLEKGADVYNIKNKLFQERIHPDKLKKYDLTPDTLKNITVNFHLETQGVSE